MHLHHAFTSSIRTSGIKLNHRLTGIIHLSPSAKAAERMVMLMNCKGLALYQPVNLLSHTQDPNCAEAITEGNTPRQVGQFAGQTVVLI